MGQQILALQGAGALAILDDDDLHVQVLTPEIGGKILLNRGETVILISSLKNHNRGDSS